MSDKNKKNFEIPRPQFPKRAVVTGGMPYGNKELHFGHVGGMLVFADTYTRFLRDRIGKDNVIFVTGTDCYGSPIAEGWRVKVEKGEFEGTLEEWNNIVFESIYSNPISFGATVYVLDDNNNYVKVTAN